MPEDNKTNQPETRTIFTQIVSIPLLMICVLILVAFSTLGVEIAGYFLGGHSGRPAAIYGFAAVCTFLSLWLVMGAIFAYLNIGQKKKIEVITGFYTPDTIADYFDQFWAGRDGFRTLVRHYRGVLDAQKPAAADALKKQFDQMFTTDFGVKVFIIPSIIFVAAAAIVLFLGYSGGLGLAVSFGGVTKPPPVLPFGIKFDLITIAAIFGAYTWIASDAIVRCHQWTLHPSDLAWYALRMIIAVPLGQALAIAASSSATAPVPAGIGAFAAFVGSMFSLDAITRTLATAATRFGLQMNSGAEERDDLIVKLAGVDESKANALSMEGVSTIGQLVTIDPIRVSIRTGPDAEVFSVAHRGHPASLCKKSPTDGHPRDRGMATHRTAMQRPTCMSGVFANSRSRGFPRK